MQKTWIFLEAGRYKTYSTVEEWLTMEGDIGYANVLRTLRREWLQVYLVIEQATFMSRLLEELDKPAAERSHPKDWGLQHPWDARAAAAGVVSEAPRRNKL